MDHQLEASTSVAPKICDARRQIDFAKALQIPIDTIRNDMSNGVPLDEDVSRLVPETNCPLCRILSSTICWHHDYWTDPAIQQNRSTPDRFVLRAFSYFRNSSWAPQEDGASEAQDYRILLSLPPGMRNSVGDHMRGYSPGSSGYVVCYPKDMSGEKGLFRPQIVPDRFDARKARLWLNDCRENHTQVCSSPSRIINGMRLIDCKTLEIIKAEPGMQWAALSYVWGKESKSPSVSQHQTQLPSSIPKTVRDSITVVLQLGMQYLWIDRYCINQQNDTEKMTQISQMDAIYLGAEITIIAAAGEDENHGLPGVSTTPRIKQDILELDSCVILTTSPEPTAYIAKKSRWLTRGWTFQEGLLSRRRLYFTNYQTMFECNTTSWMDATGGLEFIENPSEWDCSWHGAGMALFSHLLPKLPDMGSFWNVDGSEAEIQHANQYMNWFRMARIYSRRNLSFDSDALSAFTGIVRFMRSSNPPVLSMSGLPYVISREGESANLVDLHLFISMCWYHSANAKVRRRLGFPSWTWVGWTGELWWLSQPFSGHHRSKPLIRNISLEWNEGKVLLAAQHLTYSGQDIADYHLEDVIAIHLEARVVPSSLFLFNARGKYLGIDSDDDTVIEVEYDEEPSQEDWSKWSVGMHRLFLKKLAMPPWTPHELLRHLDDGSWSCLLFGDYDGRSLSHRRFLMIVEWQDDKTASRVGALVLDQHYYMDQAHPDFFDVTELEWKAVCLV